LIVFNLPCRDTLDTAIAVGDINGYMKIMETNVFTPNGDGNNDCFHPAITLQNIPGNTNAEDLQKTLMQCIEVEIFDRWGVKMFESTDNVKCWDGRTGAGLPAKEGTYYYIAKFKDLTIRGFIELMR
jgi:gliding motility-associated-like protein